MFAPKTGQAQLARFVSKLHQANPKQMANQMLLCLEAMRMLVIAVIESCRHACQVVHEIGEKLITNHVPKLCDEWKDDEMMTKIRNMSLLNSLQDSFATLRLA